MNIRMSLDEVPLTQCVKTSRKTLLPELLVLGFSPRMQHFKSKSSICA